MSKHLKGVLLALISAIFWGIGGNITDYIFKNSTFNFISIVYLRLIISGIVILLIAIKAGEKEKAIVILKDKILFLKLIIYSILAMLGLQLAFFGTLQYSNAPFATLMQFWSPIMIMVYVSIKTKKSPTFYEVLSTILIIIGVFLLITNGSLNSLVVDFRAVIFGFLTAISFSIYIIYAKTFFKYPTTLIMAYSMIISFIVLNIFIIPKNIFSNFININIIIAFILLLIIGTIIPFYFFVESCRYINPKITSLLSVGEPLTALFISIFIFKENFGLYQIIGAVLIILSVFIISFLTAERKGF